MNDKYINIDGKVKHRYNSEGNLIHPSDEGIKSFHHWFGDSTAVDEQGRPRVFYHGTDADFDTFRPQKGKTSTIFGTEEVERQGHFFTPSLDFAKEFTNSGNVMKVYLKMNKPFDMRGGVTDDMYSTMENHGISGRWLTSNNLDDWERFDGEDGKHFTDALHKSGHDSAIIFEPHGKESREAHIVFHPNQIKSVTGNTGEFSMNKNSINESTHHPMIDVDGELKHRHNSEGKPIHHTDEGIRNFHKWFGDSKVTDEHGRPLVVYHGTPHYGFDSFDISKTGNRDKGDFGKGIYFSPNKNYASSYEHLGHLNSPGDGSKTYSVYLSLKNPLYHSNRKGIPDYIDEDHDGVLAYSDKYDELPYTHHKNISELVVFHPSQIKSATDNTGEFSHPTKINESTEFPHDAIIGRLKEMHDSGRYNVTHTGYNDNYNQHEFLVSATKPANAVSFHHQKGRSEESWYNPDMAELHTPYPEDAYPRTYPVLKGNSGYSKEIQDEQTPGVLYRGMSHEEFQNIKKTGQIKSHGDFNLEGQEGLTYYSRSPSQAAHYAHGFAPAQFKASGRHNVYVVAVKDPNSEVKIAGTGEDEVGIPHPISADDILHVHVGKAYASHPGHHSISKEWDGKYSEGSSSQPSTYVGWKKMSFREL